MRKLLRSTLAAGLIAVALSANAQDDDQARFTFDGRDEDSRECGAGNGFFFFRNVLKVVGLTSDQRLICFDEYRRARRAPSARSRD